MFKTYGLTQIFSPGLWFRFMESLYEVSRGIEYTPTNTYHSIIVFVRPPEQNGNWSPARGITYEQITMVTHTCRHTKLLRSSSFMSSHILGIFDLWLSQAESPLSPFWSVPFCFYRTNPDFGHQRQVKWTARSSAAVDFNHPVSPSSVNRKYFKPSGCGKIHQALAEPKCQLVT